MEFERLLAAVPEHRLVRPAVAEVRGIAFDSRQVVPGDCFVCRRGLRDDGHAYVDAALHAGAVAIVAERPVEAPPSVGLALVPDGRQALAVLARCFWGYPDRELGLIGVTGTDGKTTTARLIAWMLQAYGHLTGELTTVNARLGDRELDGGRRLTTPEAPVVAALLRRMRDAGAQWAVLEVASHALELARVDGFAFDRAVITNVTQEHLDLHGNVENYRRTKRRLLELLDATEPAPHGRVAVLNADDPVVAGFRENLRSEALTFGVTRPADIRARHAAGPDGALRVWGTSPWGEWSVQTALLGSWNASNLAAAVACVGSVTGDLSAGVAALARFAPVPGRMQPVERGQPFRVIVDFAHTPPALEACLRDLRRTTPGRLIVVFGSAGEQDHVKRPLLGQVVARLADRGVVADEDPRGEAPEVIAAGILVGAAGVAAGATMEVVLDRREAIRQAFRLARAADTVLLAGKGHETSIIYADRTQPWDERRVAEEELTALGYGDR